MAAVLPKLIGKNNKEVITVRDTKEKFTRLTVALHWTVAILFIGILLVGMYMTEFEEFSLYSIHKSFGFILLMLAIVRVIWRYMNGWPIPVGEYSPTEHVLAKVVHWILIVGILLMPISGMLMSISGGRGLYVFGIEILASFPDPENARKVIVQHEQFKVLGESLHGWGANIILVALVLHIVGALKHHIIDKDVTLRRMLGKKL